MGAANPEDAPITVVPYCATWPARFASEALLLQSALRPWLVGGIEHIGSTAVPGLWAKPVIDIMALVSWAADGFPIYARYGYTDAANATSEIKVVKSSYRTKSAPDAGRPATSLYPMGTFLQDFEYMAGLGDLDECNGRTGVTPEFPKGIYHYFATETFPYLQRCVKGSL